MLRFSKANNKIKALALVPALAVYLAKREGERKSRKIYSLDLLSGYSCPFARECLSKVHVDDNGKRSIVDGAETEFRCFSASQEALHTNVYNLRKHNFDSLRSLKTSEEMAGLILASLPDDVGIVRIHVAGDFFNQAYFDAWVAVSEARPDVLFYAYTKSLPFWDAWETLPENFVLTASHGGRRDDLIAENGLRSAVVILSESEANGLDIDHDDSHAANPATRDQSFALLIHGTQPKGSEAAAAVKSLKGVGSYGKGTKV